MDHETIPPDLRQALWSTASTLILAWIGRLSWHVRQVQKRRRRFWSTHLLWELPTAIAIGFVADGISAYFHLDGAVAKGVTIMVAYLGPAGIEAIILRIIDRNSLSGEER